MKYRLNFFLKFNINIKDVTFKKADIFENEKKP